MTLRSNWRAWLAFAHDVCAAALACRAFAPGAGAAALFAWCIGYAVAFAAIDYHWRRRPTATR